MLKKINDFLAGWPMTILGGVFLLLSFILPRAGFGWGENFAWVCVVICGIPLAYLAIWRVIHNRGISKISSALLITIAMIAALLIGDLFAAGEVAFIMEIGALVLATPTAIMAAIGQATKHGVIIKSGEALEKMGSVDTIALDKTGTLTYGRLEVSDVISCSDKREAELLRIAGATESRSEHPLGKAITACAKEKGLSLPNLSDFQMSAGKGVSATIDGARYALGNEKYIAEHGACLTEEVSEQLSVLRSKGKASVLMAEGNTVIGIIALSDVLRPEAKETIRRLSDMGTKTVLLTGDHRAAAEYFAEKIGIREIRAELLPEEKVAQIQKLKESGKVCMIGDGVNDAPALKTADVGVAMGAMGSDIAVDAADVALMTDDISRLPYLKWLSNTTVKTIRGAITLSMCINFVAVTLSVLGGLKPTTGALVHNAGSCFVVLLAALLYDRKYK